MPQNSGAECKYEFIQGPGKHAKVKTKPGLRPPSEQAMKSVLQSSSSLSTLEAENSSESSIELFEDSSVPILPPILDNWGNNLTLPTLPAFTTPSFIPQNTGALFSVSTTAQSSAPAQGLSYPQGSWLRPSLISNETAPFLESSHPHSSSIGQNYSSSDYYEAYRTNGIASNSPLGVDVPTSPPELLDEEEDSEGIKEIFCLNPLILNWKLESNTLSFVLQSYGQWIQVAIFEPLKVIHETKENVICQLSGSSASRTRLLLTARIMRALAKSWVLEDTEKRVLGMLRGEVLRNTASYTPQEWLHSEDKRGHAYGLLDHMIEVVSLQVCSVPLRLTLDLLQIALPVFLAACPSARPPHMLDILLKGGLNLSHFVAADVAICVTTGRPLLCRYHVPWSLDLCNEFMEKVENQGSQWLFGIPDQFILLIGYIDGLVKNATAAGITVDSGLLAQIEDDVRRIQVSPCESNDPSLVVARMAVQQCWREAVIVYLYMALGGAHALDPRVVRAQTGFMRLVKSIKPGRNPDGFLVIPMIVVAVASTKRSHRQLITSRILSLPECAHPSAAGNEMMLTLMEVWAKTDLECRPPLWNDLREACMKVTGV
ncbi:unnamed protein product [Rhizoctonia solani]|uniref:Uncharacterized protein n=1 Tax=Rhizoctonia solani TaxID=456999 RepID=A0A8H3CUD6_9AGAM|nr:unnamed protein product [Rhizoctonia solani]